MIRHEWSNDGKGCLKCGARPDEAMLVCVQPAPAPAQGTETPMSFDDWWNSEPKDEAGVEYGLDEYHLLREGWRACITNRARPLERELSSANAQIAALREALERILISGNAALSIDNTAKEMALVAHAALAATRKET